jgi:hypothetical protein
MVVRRAGIALLLAAAASCGRGTPDVHTEAARKRILALDAAEASRIVAFCQSWQQEGGLSVEQFPSALPVRPTSASATANAITFAWWNNSHADEREPHPGFELICSERAIPGAKPIAAGLWYRDVPTNGGS